MSKIPFSIEYRPLIESGEYKVEIGREDPWPARIVCWDLNGDNIIAVVMNPEGREEGLIYTKQGKHNAICPRIDSDLFIIIPEPELTESEDERIRKELKEAFEAYDIESTWNGIPIRSMLAWLEKQKEQKPVEWNDKDMKEARENLITCCRDWEKGEPTTLLPIVAKRARHFLENTKPAEWSEEDKKVIDAACALLSEYAGYYREKDMEAKDLQLYRVSQRLKSLRPQPKQGWSEEDESRLDHAITTLAENVKRGSAREDFEFLASLPRRFNLQPKTEWSEEDRRTIDRACVALRAYANGELPDILPSEILGYADKLQSLRPSWKPSEEQMEALEYVIRDYREDSCNATANYLQEILDHLKNM